MAVIIEMVGAPGAGKSTMVPGVEEGCRARGLSPFTVASAARPLAARTALGRAMGRLLPKRLEHRSQWAAYRLASGWHTLRVAVTHLPLTRYVLSSQRGRPPEADARQRKVVYWYLRMMGSYGLLRSVAGHDEVIVVDEGFVHRAVQLHASPVESPTRAQIATYLACLPRPDLVVHVSASPEVCRRRVQARGVWARLGHRSPEEIERFLQHAHETVALVRAEMDRRGWPVVDIDNDRDDPTEAIAALARAVAESVTTSPDPSKGRPR